MKKVMVVIMVALLVSTAAWSQKKTQFRSQNYLGILEGESGTAFQLQTINGFGYQSWFAGIGTGIDYYSFRTIPVFFSLTKYVNQHNRSFFITADAGVSYPWENKSYHGEFYWGDVSYKKGLYWGSGMGYKFGLKRSGDAVLVQLGYSYKHLEQVNSYVNPCLWGPCPETTESYNYRLNRLSLKLGYMF